MVSNCALPIGLLLILATLFSTLEGRCPTNEEKEIEKEHRQRDIVEYEQLKKDYDIAANSNPYRDDPQKFNEYQERIYNEFNSKTQEISNRPGMRAKLARQARRNAATSSRAINPHSNSTGNQYERRGDDEIRRRWQENQRLQDQKSKEEEDQRRREENRRLLDERKRREQDQQRMQEENMRRAEENQKVHEQRRREEEQRAQMENQRRAEQNQRALEQNQREDEQMRLEDEQKRNNQNQLTMNAPPTNDAPFQQPPPENNFNEDYQQKIDNIPLKQTQQYRNSNIPLNESLATQLADISDNLNALTNNQPVPNSSEASVYEKEPTDESLNLVIPASKTNTNSIQSKDSTSYSIDKETDDAFFSGFKMNFPNFYNCNAYSQKE